MIILRLLFYFILSLIMLFLAILLGQEGAWYFAWVLGTVMIVLISASGGVLLDAQEEHNKTLS
ncbi:MAG: hypothetical protein KGQ58_03905 [Proteobacteria bacterium]|nr:hypothetical protein [Pseudomonadota bacterium]